MSSSKSESANTLSATSSTIVIERELQKVSLNNPIVICGFVGPGLAGLTAAGYIIEHLELHEVAHVRSRYIPPSVIFIGGRIRNPFRIYRDDSGKLAVVICEVPVASSGLYDISSILLGWLKEFNPTEIVALDGIPINNLQENRPTFYVAEENRKSVLEGLGFLPAEATLIGGTAGSILSECLARKIQCLALLVPVSVALLDPGAPLALVRALNSLYMLNITTKELEEDVEMIHEELNEIAKTYQSLQDQASAGKTENIPQTMYR
ncbi:MAG TPA: PAC2 family protein [Nitrososphaerales archaeon]|nr:PAC2 family protein [Nitrososphaerales archaeon]